MIRVVKTNQNKAIVVNGSPIAIRVVPSGYTELAGITCNNNAYYNTGLYLESTDIIKFSYLATATCYVLGALNATDATDNFTMYHVSNGKAYVRYGNLANRVQDTNNVKYNIVVTPTGITGLDEQKTWSQQTFTTSYPLYIGWSPNTTQAKLKGTLYGEIEVVGKAKYVPVERDSDGAIGYYDVYSDTFFENQGASAPTPIYVNS